MLMVLLKSMLKDDYPRSWGIILEVFSVVLMLTVFWFTSLAFKPTTLTGDRYFDYLLIGEFILYLPLLLLQQNIRLGKKMARRGTFDFLHVQGIASWRYFMSFSQVYFVKDLIKLIIMMIVTKIFFTLPLSAVSIVGLLIYVSLVSFLFALLGMAIGLSLVFWGRGEGVWGQFISLGSVLGGAYFPVMVFPVWLQKASLILNPITCFLEYGRSLVKGNYAAVSPSMVLWVILIPMVCYIVYTLGLKRYLKWGPPSDISF